MGERTGAIAIANIRTRQDTQTVASEHETNHMSPRLNLDDLEVRETMGEQSVDFACIIIKPSPPQGPRANSRGWKSESRVR